jgi:nitronate monooxygenase
VLAAQAMGAISPTWARASSRRRRRTQRRVQAVDHQFGRVGHHLHEPVHGRARQLHPREHRRAGLDPDNLPVADKSKMDFSSGAKAKAWKDIWGAGQGVGQIHDIPPPARSWRA